MLNMRDAGKQEVPLCRKGERQDRRDSGQDGCKKRGIQDRREAGKEGSGYEVCRRGKMLVRRDRNGGMQEKREEGKEGSGQKGHRKEYRRRGNRKGGLRTEGSLGRTDTGYR